jgi:hypothetical protein
MIDKKAFSFIFLMIIDVHCTTRMRRMHGAPNQIGNLSVVKASATLLPGILNARSMPFPKQTYELIIMI